MKHRGERMGVEEEAAAAPEGPPMGANRTDVQRILGLRNPPPPQEERALSDMLEGFHRFLRYLHDNVAESFRAQPAEKEDSGG
jgi:hypothetical protein